MPVKNDLDTAEQAPGFARVGSLYYPDGRNYATVCAAAGFGELR
jgi:hypothetical protein